MGTRRSVLRAMVLVVGLWGVLTGPGCDSTPEPPATPNGGQQQVVVQTPSERFDGGLSHAELWQARMNLHRRLVLEKVDPGVAAPISIQVTRDELLELAQRNVDNRGPLLVGVTKPVSVVVDLAAFSPETLPRQSTLAGVGAIRQADDGGFVWTVVVQSEGAKTLRVHLADVSLPPNTELYIYSTQGQAFGPYTGRGPDGTGDFWSHSVRGPKAFVQLRHHGPTLKSDLVSSWFVIDRLAHIDPETLTQGARRVEEDWFEEDVCFNTGAAPCLQNAMCYCNFPDPEDNNDPFCAASNAVAMIIFDSGPYTYLCSGGLLADTDADKQIPYFLTANHCVSSDSEATSLEAHFQYRTDDCADPCADPGPAQVLGATLLSTKSKGDYSLLKLNQDPPAGSVFLGWTNEPVAFTGGTILHRLSHPDGGPQGYSQTEVDPDGKITCGGWKRGPMIYSEAILLPPNQPLGGTMGGSSGSPVLNEAGQVVGQLTGACGYNVYDDCDTDGLNRTVDGAFAYYFPSVEQWLDPAPCVDNDGDGYEDAACGGDDCNDSDADIYPGAQEICDDGVDNDCDLLADCDDSDCAADPACNGDCLPVGDPCTSDEQCCSQKCRGKRGGKICR